MESIGRHIFIFIYIISFFIGIYTFTLNKTMLVETGRVIYKKLNMFYFAFFSHIIINFIYFYKSYFISIWEWKIIILFAINASMVIFIYFGIEVLAEICRNAAAGRKRKAIIMTTGILYVVVYEFVRIYYINETERLTELVSSIAFICANACFMISGLYYCRKYNIFYKKGEYISGYKAPLYFLMKIISIYLILNFIVDIYFGIAKERLMLFGISLYNLTIFVYLAMNILLILFFYTKDLRQVKKDERNNPYNENVQLSIEELSTKYNLTSREKELLQYVYQGESSPVIAEILNISSNTVKRHLSNIYSKLGVNHRIELIHMIRKD